MLMKNYRLIASAITLASLSSVAFSAEKLTYYCQRTGRLVPIDGARL